jgi:S1-C subfamily serine protease
VVMIIADDVIGTGFFISRDLVVTNRHVVEQARRLFIAGKYVGLAPAQPVALGRETALTDFALLRVSPQPSVMPFGLAVPSRPMTPIIAAGYPGLHLTTDVMYQRLRSGDATAAAGLSPVFQTGVVSHLQPHAEQAVTLVIHGAEIAPGNSGGPLLDYCGRVVGVNTFGRTEERLPVTARYALGSDGLGAFLLSVGQDAALASEPCQPTTSNTEAASRAPASAETADSPASGQAEPPLPGPASAPVPGAALVPGSAPVSGSPPGGPSAPAGIPAVRGDRALGSSPTQGATPASGPAGPKSDRATPPASSTPPSQGAPARRPIPTEPSSLSRTPPVPVPPAAPR